MDPKIKTQCIFFCITTDHYIPDSCLKAALVEKGLKMWTIVFAVVIVVLLATLVKNTRLASLEAKVYALSGYFPLRILDAQYEYDREPDGKNDVLIVAFAGGGVLVGGVPLKEFSRTIRKIPGCDALLLTDIHQLWYLRDENGQLKTLVKDICLRYKKVLMIGNCLGGTGALFYSEMADRVLAFGPQTNIVHCRNWFYWLNGFRQLPCSRHDFTGFLLQHTRKCRGHIYCIFSNTKDREMASYVQQEANIDVSFHGNAPVVPKHLKANGQLLPLLKKHIDAMMMMTTTKSID